MEITSPSRTIAHLESHFHFDSPESVRPPSTYGTPERARRANPQTWQRNKWVCDAPCDFCGVCTNAKLALKAATCKSSCKLECTVKAPMVARKKVRALRHDAYTKGACTSGVYRKCILQHTVHKANRPLYLSLCNSLGIAVTVTPIIYIGHLYYIYCPPVLSPVCRWSKRAETADTTIH
jgi:hypothetical protein